MPEEDSDKAEKLAAAKKRFEQLKKEKEQGKKGTKAGTAKKKATGEKKKKETKSDEPSEAAEAETPAAAEETTEAAEKEDTVEDGPVAEAEDAVTSPLASAGGTSHGRAPSMSLQSKMRSESFRRGSIASSPIIGKSPGATSPPADAHEAYLKQATRLDDLEKENKRLAKEAKDGEDRWRKLEAELDELREGRAELGGAKQDIKARDEKVDKLRSDIAILQRQNAHLQSQSSARSRGGASPGGTPSADSKISDLTAQLASKSSTIESLETDLSTTHSQLSNLKNQLSTQSTRISSLESSLREAESRANSASSELEALKSNLESAREAAGSTASTAEQQRDEATTRAARLDAELGATKKSLEEAAARSSTLEKKVDTLTSLRREAESREATRARESERENRELRARVAALDSRVREDEEDADGLGELEDEAREKLRKRIRELEDEVFELQRGIWRERRRELQPHLEIDGGSGALGSAGGDGFAEVELMANSAMSPAAKRSATHSTFSDVINSGISAFTGQPRHGRRGSSIGGAKVFTPATAGPRKNSLGLLSEGEDDEFDEDAFRLAHEEESKRRIERVKEIKRGLDQWKGWRVDLTEVRQVLGGMFEV